MNAQNRTVNVWYVPRKKDVFNKKDDIITAAEKYIQENGTGAFRDIIDKVTTWLHLSGPTLEIGFYTTHQTSFLSGIWFQLVYVSHE